MRLGRFGSRGAALAATCMALAAATASGQVVISQLYGGGNAAGGKYTIDYVELFNKGNTPVVVDGWSVQTSSQTLATSAWARINISGTIQPGQFYLVQAGQLVASPQGLPIPTPDAVPPASPSISTVNLSASFGAAALVTNQTTLSSVCPIGNGAVIDYIHYHDSTQAGASICYEGTAVGPHPDDQQRAVLRKDGGCKDTNDGAADFEIGTANPRNSTVNGMVSSAFAPNRIINLTGGNTTLTVSRADIPCNFLTTLTTVTANLSAFGGSASQTLTNGGGGVFTHSLAAPSGLSTGIISVPVTATDGTFTINTRAFIEVTEVPPVNDECVNAIDLGPSGTFFGSIDNRGATDDVTTGSCATGTPSKAGVWFRYQPSQTEILTLSETGTQNIKWGVFTGSCAALTGIACTNSEGNETGTAGPQARYRVSAGTQYYILAAHELASVPLVAMNFAISSIAAPPAPDNDDCAGAIPITFPFIASPNAEGAQNDAPAPSCAATFSGLPAALHGIWYSFSTASSGRLQLISNTSVNSAAFALYTGTCGSLTEVGCHSSGIAVPGPGSYLLLVYKNTTGLAPNGPFELDLRFFPTPANDTCTTATDISATTFPFQVNQSIFAAGDDPDISCNTSPDVFGRAVWFKYTAAADGVLRIVNDTVFSSVFAWFSDCSSSESGCHGTGNSAQFIQMTAGDTYYVGIGEWLRQTSDRTEPIIATFDFAPVSTNITCADAADLTSEAFPFTRSYNQSGASDLPAGTFTCRGSNQVRKAQYFKYTSSVHGRFRVEVLDTLCNFLALRQIGPDPCNNPADLEIVGCTIDSRLSFTINPGQNYYIIAADASPLGVPASNIAPRRLVFEVGSGVPNDQCSTATDITASPSPFSEAISDIRFNGDDPDVACNTASAAFAWHGVWYSYTPSVNSAITVSETSATNVVMAVYDGCGGTAVCLNPEENYFELNAGTTYKILVAYDSSAPVFVSATPMTNFIYKHPRVTHDLCSNARLVDSTSYTDTTNLDPATADTPAANQTGCNATAATVMQDSVWYKIVVTGSGQLTGSINFDVTANRLGVWAIYQAVGGNCPSSGPPLACGVDGTNIPASINVSLNAGSTYYLQFGRSGTSGTTAGSLADLSLQFSGTIDGGNVFCCRGTTCTSVPGGTCTGVVAGSNSTVVATCTGNSFAGCCFGDYDHNGTKDITDIFTFLNAWFSASSYADITSNGVATPDITDIFTFLNAWFGTCS